MEKIVFSLTYVMRSSLIEVSIHIHNNEKLAEYLGLENNTTNHLIVEDENAENSEFEYFPLLFSSSMYLLFFTM